jgi:hypothetical protein
MTPFRYQHLLLSVLFIVVTLIGCGQSAGWLSACGSHIAKNSQEAEAFESKLNGWLKTNDFIRTNDPGGMTSSAGVHSVGEITTWYRGSFRDSPPFLLRVQTVPRNDVGGGWTDYHFDCAWQVFGSTKQISETKAISERFAEDFTTWLEESKAPADKRDADAR